MENYENIVKARGRKVEADPIDDKVESGATTKSNNVLRGAVKNLAAALKSCSIDVFIIAHLSGPFI